MSHIAAFEELCQRPEVPEWLVRPLFSVSGLAGTADLPEPKGKVLQHCPRCGFEIGAVCRSCEHG